MSKNLDILRNLGAVAKELENRKPSKEFWERQEQLLIEQYERRLKMAELIRMSDEKYHKRFTI